MNNINLQDAFLNNVRKEKIKINIYLLNGYKISGLVKGFDNYVIFLESDKGQQMIYKHSIATIVPSQNFRLFNNEQEMEQLC